MRPGVCQVFNSDVGKRSNLMDTNTLLIIIVVILLLGGGGFYFRR